MKTLPSFTLLSLILVAQAILAPGARAVPTCPDGSVGKPLFETSEGFKTAGVASVIKVKQGSQCFLVSVRHLLSPKNGFSKQIAASEVPDFVRNIKLNSFSGPSYDYFVTGLPLDSTGRDPMNGPLDDLAVYQVHNESPSDRALSLTTALPAVGETVWLVAKDQGGGEIMQSGKVAATNGGKWLTVQFDDPSVLTAAGGAPVLNAAGEVIGIFSHDEGGSGAASLIPSTVILKAASKAH